VLGFLTSPAWDAVTLWSLDLETGGLDARRDPVLAVGLVPIRGGTIRLGEAWGSLVRPPPGAAVRPESVRAHQLVPADLAAAPPLAAVLPEVDRRLREGALIVHGRAIDLPFLRAAYRAAGLRWPRPPVVDTADLLLRAARREASDAALPEDAAALRLDAARTAHGLPAYPAHDAVTDALAAAELFLVLRARLGARTLRALR
jgi:DNA polymerase-3 subunit epsilon